MTNHTRNQLLDAAIGWVVDHRISVSSGARPSTERVADCLSELRSRVSPPERRAVDEARDLLPRAPSSVSAMDEFRAAVERIGRDPEPVVEPVVAKAEVAAAVEAKPAEPVAPPPPAQEPDETSDTVELVTADPVPPVPAEPAKPKRDPCAELDAAITEAEAAVAAQGKREREARADANAERQRANDHRDRAAALERELAEAKAAKPVPADCHCDEHCDRAIAAFRRIRDAANAGASA